MSRVDKLRAKVGEQGLDAFLVSQAENRRYLSRFTGSAGFLLIAKKRAILATDFRYVEQATKQAPGFDIFQIQGQLRQWFPKLIAEVDPERLGFEADDISFAVYQQLVESAKEIQTGAKLELIPTRELVESLRAVKQENELRCILGAAELADEAIAKIAAEITPGMTERQIAWEIEKLLREKGSQGLAFDIIVASGPNSALPHAQPSEHAVVKGEPIVIDMGARVEGYCSDMTRTLILGEPDDKLRRVYDIVLGAQLTAIATMGAGMSGHQVDSLGRVVIEEAGFGQNFGHALGHGVGLATHELPRLGKDSKDILSDGMVVTVEPGIYIEGWGGVRIEDMVFMEKGRAKLLTKAKKTLD